MFVVCTESSWPCDFIVAVLAYLITCPPTPCVAIGPMRSKLLRQKRSNVTLMRLLRKPSSEPMLNSCFFSYVSWEFSSSLVMIPDSLSVPTILYGVYALSIWVELV